jgi:cyclophilin family peptidyl-prolyl cis-trans isomerase
MFIALGRFDDASRSVAVSLAGCTEPVAPLDANAGEDQVVAPEEFLTLAGEATGGIEPLVFRWTVERQPDGADVDLAGREMGSSLAVGTLAVTGRYQFRLRVTDASGATDMSFVNVDVGGDLAVTATARDVLRTVGESTPVSVSIDADTSGLSNKRFAWTVAEGGATIADASAASTDVTITDEATAKLRVTVTADEDGNTRTGIAVVNIVGVRDATPQVVIENTGAVSGELVVELFGNEAPRSVANFLRYVDAGFYDGLVWHRVDGDFVIQTGAYERAEDRLTKRFGVRPAIAGEAGNGRTNIRGAVGVALRNGDADSGDSQFYVNVVDNLELDSGTPPFTVFGRVVAGLEEVADAIAAVDVDSDPSGLDEVPVNDIVMQRVSRAVDEVPTDSDSNGPLIEVEVSAEADDALRIVGESTRLRATVADPPDDLNFTWTVVAGEASFAAATSAETDVTIAAPTTTQLRVTVRGEGVLPASADVFVVGVENANPRVVISNTGGVTGDIILRLFTEEAPGTCANFLRYVDERFFDGIVWHRVDEGFVIQGGAFERGAEGLVERSGVRPPIQSEANNGRSNIRGTVAMALRGTDANSGTNQFFVNLGDNSGLDNGSPPFTVFAEVVEGLNVVDDIGTVGVGTDDFSGLSDVPLVDIVMSRVRRETESAGGTIAKFASAGNDDRTARLFHTATLMDNLEQPIALIAGGLGVNENGGLTSLADVTFFDPSTGEFSNTFVTTNGESFSNIELTTPRSHHQQITLRRSRIFIVGGETGASDSSVGDPTATSELFDPGTGQLTVTASMAVSRGRGHAATRMPPERVLVSGDSTWEVYRPIDDDWLGPFDLTHTRLGHATLSLTDIFDNAGDFFIDPVHRALLIGGEGSGSNTLETLQVDTEESIMLSSVLPFNLRDMAAANVVIEENLVLIVGGVDLDTGNSIPNAWLLKIPEDTLREVDPLPNRSGGIANHQVIALDDRYAVVVGGEQVSGETRTPLDYYAVFDVETESWIESGLTLFPRANAAATALDDRSILVVGGGASGDPPTQLRRDGEVLTLEIDTNGAP